MPNVEKQVVGSLNGPNLNLDNPNNQKQPQLTQNRILEKDAPLEEPLQSLNQQEQPVLKPDQPIQVADYQPIGQKAQHGQAVPQGQLGQQGYLSQQVQQVQGHQVQGQIAQQGQMGQQGYLSQQVQQVQGQMGQQGQVNQQIQQNNFIQTQQGQVPINQGQPLAQQIPIPVQHAGWNGQPGQNMLQPGQAHYNQVPLNRKQEFQGQKIMSQAGGPQSGNLQAAGQIKTGPEFQEQPQRPPASKNQFQQPPKADAVRADPMGTKNSQKNQAQKDNFVEPKNHHEDLGIKKDFKRDAPPPSSAQIGGRDLKSYSL